MTNITLSCSLLQKVSYLLTVLFKEPQLEALVKLELFMVPELQKVLLGCTDSF
jgi:hypothetical protein